MEEEEFFHRIQQEITHNSLELRKTQYTSEGSDYVVKDKRYHYITPDDYVEAEKRGISRKTLNDRVRRYNMDVDTAIVKPLKKMKSFEHKWQEWKDVCEKHGISRRLFYHRMHVSKYTEEVAATKEIERGGYKPRRAVSCNG